jgi:hypothetical protein
LRPMTGQRHRTAEAHAGWKGAQPQASRPGQPRDVQWVGQLGGHGSTSHVAPFWPENIWIRSEPAIP